MANGHPYIIDCNTDFKSDKMSSENDEWSDCEWFDEVANNIILDIERRQLALEIQVETLSMHHVIIISKECSHIKWI